MEATIGKKISICDAKEICIIDDSSIPRRISEKVCQFALPNIPVVTFETVNKAIVYLRSTGPKKRTIFLDLYMPEKNGWDFLSLYELHFEENLYLLTTSDDENDIARAKQYQNISGYLLKPLSVQKLKTL